ncbi:MAG: TRAP transporter fused permease subunit [Rhizobiaceae bacterium]|nr:TRAP transporter fused permease subunit [Rhizobiaceae bacterium]
MVRIGLVKLYDYASAVFAVAMSVFAIYVAAFGVFDNIIVSGLTVLLAVLYGFVAWRGNEDAPEPRWLLVLHGLMAVAVFALILDWADLMFEQEMFFISISVWQDAAAWTAILLITYLTYRFFGIPMVLVIIAAGIYVLAPSSLGGGNEHWTRVAENLWFSTDGVFGRPVEVVGRIVLIYVILGAILQTAGAGEVLLKMAFAATGRLAGGPAHAAIVGSAMFGTMSGAAVANVVSTGVFTIPIIKKVGFTPRFAGGIEAAASTGGQIMPPVMGAVAFLMADVTGIPYLNIIVAAFIPALMYYGSLFAFVHVEARRNGIGALPKEQRIRLTRDDLVKSIAFWVPLGVIVSVLLTGRTAQNAGAYAAATAFVACLILFPKFRHPARWLEALIDAGRASAVLMIVVAAIGFVIGVVNMTGIGLAFAEGVLAYANSSLALALVMVMLASLVLGMGVPTGAAYLIIAIVLGPAISRLGVPVVAAHLFMLYFAVLSSVTPPVALSAFAAAPIAGAKPMETGWAAMRLAAPGFIIPFLFVFHPDLLLIVEGATLGGALWACAAFAVSTWGLVTGLGGWEGERLPLWQRAIRLVAGVGALATIPGIAVAATLVLCGLSLQRRLMSRSAAALQQQRDATGRST